VHAPDVADVTTVAAAELARSAFENNDARASLGRDEGCAERSVATAQDGYVKNAQCPNTLSVEL
jgi:hypothetical protein